MNKLKIEKLIKFNNFCKELKYFNELLRYEHEIFPEFKSIFNESCEKSVFLLDNAKPLKKKLVKINDPLNFEDLSESLLALLRSSVTNLNSLNDKFKLKDSENLYLR